MTRDEIVASFGLGSPVGFYHPVKGCYVAAYIYKMKKKHVKVMYLGNDGDLLTDKFEFSELVHPPQREIDALYNAIKTFFKEDHIQWMMEHFDMSPREKK